MISDLFSNLNCGKIDQWLLSSGVKLVLILAGSFLVNRLGKIFITRFLDKSFNFHQGKKERRTKRKETLRHALISVWGVVVMVVTMLVMLSEFGVNIQALLAGIGFLGLAVGLASKQIVEDYISGFFIILSDQYGVGDEVEIAGKNGKVVDIDFRRTVLKNEDGTMHFIPNSLVKVSSRENE